MKHTSKFNEILQRQRNILIFCFFQTYQFLFKGAPLKITASSYIVAVDNVNDVKSVLLLFLLLYFLGVLKHEFKYHPNRAVEALCIDILAFSIQYFFFS